MALTLTPFRLQFKVEQFKVYISIAGGLEQAAYILVLAQAVSHLLIILAQEEQPSSP